MTVPATRAELPPLRLSLTALLDQALAEIAAGAEALDREPRFPAEAFAALAEAGALSATVGADARRSARSLGSGSWCAASPRPTPRSAASSTAT